jgi:hypothetical protein
MKTHWKKLKNNDYFGSQDLFNEDKTFELNVRIISIKQEPVQNGDKKELCMVAQIEGHKPLIVNATNSKAIAKALKSPYVEDWVGKYITLYTIKVRAFGDFVDAVRVRSEAPIIKVEKPFFGPENSKWNAAIEAIKNGTSSIEQLLETRQITDENLAILRNINQDDEIL